MVYSVADPAGSPKWGYQSEWGGRQPIIRINYLENCMKIKKIGLEARGGGGGTSPYPL